VRGVFAKPASFRTLAALLGCLSAAACRAPSRGGLEKHCAAEGLEPPSPRAVDGLPNFGPVCSTFYRSGQPTAEGLREAKRLGIRTVVNVRSSHSDRTACAEAGLRYVEIPMRQWRIRDEDVLAFLRVATDPAQGPVLLHCHQGQDRTGVLTACYRVVVEGWSREDAIRELESYGASPLWSNLRAYVRDLDVEGLRARLAPAAGRASREAATIGR
jgi:uncharacterized protein (TIGR01244 family)